MATADRGQDWFYYAPSKRNEQPQSAPAASQIPDLNCMETKGADQGDERGEKQPNRGVVYDSDTNYVKLAKQGGRKDLLVYRDPVTTTNKPVGYPWPDWFDHYEDPRNEDNQKDRPPAAKPDWSVHIEHKPTKQNSTTVSVRAPFQWPASLQEANHLPPIRKKKVKRSPTKPLAPSHHVVKQQKQQLQLPPVHNGPVAFNRLISMDYQREWFNARDKQEDERQLRARAQQAHKKQLTLKAIQTKKKPMYTEEVGKQELFKIKRFTNIPSKISDSLSQRKTNVDT
ncbi:uncharacterized protein C7orf57 homolog [Corticium candelabrum]|uniref:uncharacterized protein C7orf57 homolog n=1 Tax=Corticium candelabrum TaxID=121492 RepID=UPI002E257221|nr:uncharacterized protein C7orf57 homolog [Corticium candelabrum]